MVARKRGKSELSTLVLRPMWVTLKQALRTVRKRPVTMMYPTEKLNKPRSFKGEMFAVKNIWGTYNGIQSLDDEKCVSCGTCVRICPNKCIELVLVEERGGVKLPQIDLTHCLFCGMCAEYCPTEAMRMTTIYEVSEFNKRKLICKPEKLMENKERGLKIKYAERAKEEPQFDLAKCIGCGLCSKNCPVEAIEMVAGEPKPGEKKVKKIPKFEKKNCVGCGTCEEKCPKDAVIMEWAA